MKCQTLSQAIEGATKVNENTYVKEVPNGYRIIKGENETAYTSQLVTHEQYKVIELFLNPMLITV